MKTRTWTIFGAGDLIGDINDAVESRGHELASIVLNMKLKQEIVDRIPRSVRRIKLEEFIPATDYYFLGFIDPDKKPLLESLKKFDLVFSNLIHNFSYVPRHVEMGEGNFVGAGAVLASNVQLGNFNFVNRAASIGHDTRILHYNHFGPGCTVAGNCIIGSRNSFFTRSALVNNLKIADDITVGAGGVVVKDIMEPGTYVGVPARRVNENSPLK